MFSSAPVLFRRLAGRRSDWHLRWPDLHLPRPHLGWLGPLAVLASVLVSWPAFAGAVGEGQSVSLGLYVGAVSILLMAWSFVLAVRIRFLERFFGGLDTMYRVHRWAGSLAVVFMFWHVRVEPEIDNGIRGASESIAEAAEGLAGIGEYLLYALVALSLVRWFPYRFWRWTHKMLGVPFAFASWHFFTAEKPYANGSGWGLWFGGFMLAGLAAWIARVVVRDAVTTGRRYRVAEAVVEGSAVTIELEPLGERLEHHAGQFAFIKIQAPGLREPHAFTIASSPESQRLRFVVRELGDWTRALLQTDLVGTDVVVEGPYGTFEPVGRRDQHVVWVAGGVGITPFLSAIDTPGLTDGSGEHAVTPDLFYAVRDAGENGIVESLRAAEAQGRIRLHLFESSAGNRLSGDDLVARVGLDRLAGAHVALCGPAGLVSSMAAVAREHGAARIEREDFDIRQGFGPDLSVDVDDVLRSKGVLTS